MELETIYAPVREDLEEIEARLARQSMVDFSRLSELLGYSLKSTGKRIRPILALLSGKFYEYDREKLLRMATAVEIMHTATLIHDDSIDKSSVRRGRPTVNAVWGDEEAILLGDYLFAESGALTASTENLRAIKLFATTLKIISSGEINQAYNAFNPDQDRTEYYQRIAQKTAALFTMSTETGAALSAAPEEAIQVLIDYAYNMGIGFQIVDDILDFTGSETDLGKPIGSDLSGGTLTLPAFIVMERSPGNNPVEDYFKTREKKSLELSIESAREPSVIRECYDTAVEYCRAACKNLETLPDTPSRKSLCDLAEFITARKK